MIAHGVLSFAVLGLIWILTRMKRTLPTTEELIRKIYPEENESFSNQHSDDPIKGIVESDAKWWEDSGGYQGLFLQLRSAVCFVQLCQRLYQKTRMPMAEFAIVARKAFLLPL